MTIFEKLKSIFHFKITDIKSLPNAHDTKLARCSIPKWVKCRKRFKEKLSKKGG